MPPLALTGERTLPRRPRGELLVSPPPGRLRVDRRAGRRPARRRHGLRRGLRLGRARAHRRERGRRRRQPGGPRARAAALPQARTCASSATSSRRFAEPCDAVVFLQTIEHRGPGAVLDHFALADRARPDRLRLDPERAHARAPREPRSPTTPGTSGVPARRSSGALCQRTSTASRSSASSMRAKLRVHALAIRLGWDWIHSKLGLTRRFYDWFTPAIGSRLSGFAARPRADLDQGAGLHRSAAVSGAGRAQRRRPRDRPAHAHALRRGLRHVAVRRGVAVGGDRHQLPAAARRARPRRRSDHIVRDPGARRPARGARHRRALQGVHARRARGRPTTSTSRAARQRARTS